MNLGTFIKSLYTVFLYSTVVTSLLTFTACRKKDEQPQPLPEAMPSAGFTADKSEYVAGDVIVLTNTSTHAETYRWTLPDGSTSKSQNISFQTTERGIATDVLFRLDAFSKSGEKTDFAVKTLHVKEAYGRVVVFSNYQVTHATISIDGKSTGTTYFFPGISNDIECGEGGDVYPTFNLTVGKHILSVKKGSGLLDPTETFEVEITRNACVKVKV